MRIHLIVRHLDLSTNDCDLLRLFEQHGKVTRVAIFSDPVEETLVGFVEVDSDEMASAMTAALDQQIYFGNRLSVQRMCTTNA